MMGSIVDRASGSRRVRNSCAACRYAFAICEDCCRLEDNEETDDESMREPPSASSYETAMLAVAIETAAQESEVP